MRSLLRSTLRRSLLAVSITQLVVCSVAPLHGAAALGDRGPARIERLHTTPGAPIHDPDTCPICQLQAAQFLRPETARLAPITRTVPSPLSFETERPAARAPPAAHRTRAPPLDLA